MKSVERILGYVEGKLEEAKKYEPPKIEYYLLSELLEYIKEED